jgi:hypothetical protein
MTSNVKRLGALAVAQCGAFVIVLIFGAFGGPGHPGPARPAPAPTATHASVSPSATHASVSPSATGSPSPGKSHK